MFLRLLEYCFILSGAIFVILLGVYKFWVSKLEYSPKISTYVSCMAGALLAYSVCATGLMFCIDGIFNKLLVGIFGIIPFLIGKYATFETEKYYSLLQMFVMIYSIIFVVWV